MCGITGWVDWERDLTREGPALAAMAATMACRGPDSGGTWISPRAALGHRRLAVIDVQGGIQPMSEPPPAGCAAAGAAAGMMAGPPSVSLEAGQVVLVFSGEVYNFVPLRGELQARGHRFRTRSDTEVVLRAYLEWGADAVPRLTGMFAFAIWDGYREELLLARDRLGVKPLYYARCGSALLFGSEPKAILASSLIEPEIDEAGIAETLGLWPFKTPGTALYRGLHELKPGRVLFAGHGGVRESRYWSLPATAHTDDLAATSATVRRLVQEAVAGQVTADVPLCSLLSGGLDSSLLTALAVGAPGRADEPLATFSVDFRDGAADFRPDRERPSHDAPYAREMARYLATEHHDVILDPDGLAAAEEAVVAARDLPSMGDLDGALLLFFREVRPYATVALSGESADEVFGGYPWVADEARAPSGTFPWMRFQRSGALVHPDVRKAIRFDEYVQDRYADAVAEVPVLPGEESADRRMRVAYYLGITRFLPALLDRKDRLSMAVGLEVRVPFCDHRLVEYVWNVPWQMKAAGGAEKGLLRQAAAGLLPDGVRSRPKSRFPAPQGACYQQAVLDRARDLVTDSTSPLRSLLNVSVLSSLTSQRTPPQWRAAITTSLASFLSIDTWLRRYNVRIR